MSKKDFSTLQEISRIEYSGIYESRGWSCRGTRGAIGSVAVC
jgi:hypothetical protein